MLALRTRAYYRNGAIAYLYERFLVMSFSSRSGFLAAGIAATLLLFGIGARAQTVAGFGAFSLIGGATANNDVLKLTEGGASEDLSAFYTSAVNYAGNFTNSFTYTASGNKATDGAAFVLQKSASGAAALGSVGGSLDFNSITSSVAIELNLYNSGDTNYATNGVTGIYSTTDPVNLASGNTIRVDL